MRQYPQRGSKWNKERQWTGLGQFERDRTVIARITGAVMRSILIAILIATPALIVPGIHDNAPEMIVLMALLGGGLTFIEYASNYPSIVEFRDAPPLNRIRFLTLFATVFFLAVISKHSLNPTALTALMSALGTLIGEAADFPYSPVRLAILMLPETAPFDLYHSVRMAAGVSYTFSVIAILSFLFLVRGMGWPTSTGAFNVWVNLPLFDPTSGGDVVYRLQRDARINIILGVLLPFLIPAIVKAASGVLDPTVLGNPHTLIWMLSAWAFLPASMIMRGIAMSRIADLIQEKRRRAYGDADPMPTI